MRDNEHYSNTAKELRYWPNEASKVFVSNVGTLLSVITSADYAIHAQDLCTHGASRVVGS